MSRSVHVRTTLIAPAVCAGLLLAGCGGESGADDGAVSLGFVNGGTSEFHTCLEKAVQKAAKADGAELITVNSRQNAATELANMEDLIARGVDAIILQTVNNDALEGGIAKAKAAGIPLYLTSVVSDPDDILGAVVVDLKKVGRLDADWVAEDAGGEQVQAGVIAGAPGAASDLLVEGFVEGLPDNVTVVANQPGMFNAAKAQDVADNMIQAHPELRYAFVANEEMALAARKAFDAAGADVRIVTTNGTEAGLEAVRSGKLSATVANSPIPIGETAVRNTLDALDEKRIEKVSYAPYVLVTADNADQAPRYCP
ncbi:sugar ABC transporter substrate-binding protein [Streptomyces sp. MMCC 100]|uniref:sugar ABC transporter substrate-binding protein n=1 Tax=Streptomyces sp. MMCC 100 TaxID=3163555 RepID=UPI003595C578